VSCTHMRDAKRGVLCRRLAREAFPWLHLQLYTAYTFRFIKYMHLKSLTLALPCAECRVACVPCAEPDVRANHRTSNHSFVTVSVACPVFVSPTRLERLWAFTVRSELENRTEQRRASCGFHIGEFGFIRLLSSSQVECTRSTLSVAVCLTVSQRAADQVHLFTSEDNTFWFCRQQWAGVSSELHKFVDDSLVCSRAAGLQQRSAGQRQTREKPLSVNSRHAVGTPHASRHAWKRELRAQAA
jgi:hypothetical protein